MTDPAVPPNHHDDAAIVSLRARHPAWDIAEGERGWLLARLGAYTVRALDVPALERTITDYEEGRTRW